MFRRNMIGVLDPFPPFPSTPPLTQLSLRTGICCTGADPRGGPLFGRMVAQSPLTKDTWEWLRMTMTMTMVTCSLVKKALTCPQGQSARAMGYLADEEHTLSANTMKQCVPLRSRAACRGWEMCFSQDDCHEKSWLLLFGRVCLRWLLGGCGGSASFY